MYSPISAPFIDVPTKEEELKMGDCNGIAPQIAKNAQKLIDFALSFIPPRDGPRRTKEKRRMQLRREQREVRSCNNWYPVANLNRGTWQN